jgi:hypothetical protein
MNGSNPSFRTISFSKRDLWVAAILCLELLFLPGCLSPVIYHPSRELQGCPENIGLAFERASFETADGVSLSGWWIPADSPRGVLLFCHGNAGNISHRLDSIQVFNRLGLSVLIFDYRGYGQSGGNPEEEGLYRDAEAAWRYLIQERGADPDRIVVLGRSLGGAVAARLARTHNPRALILESAFISLVEAGRDRVAGFLADLFVPDQYPTLRNLEAVRCPVLIIHSRDDEIVPFRHGAALYAAAPEPKEFLQIRGSHNRGFLDTLPVYRAGLDSFLAKTMGKQKGE